jgi:biotin operon repressor
LLDLRVGGCQQLDGARSRAACPRVASLRAKLGNVERKAELEASLAGLHTAAPAATNKTADSGASALATYREAIGIVFYTGLLTEWLVLVSVVALELGSAVSLVLVQAVSVTLHEHQTPSVVERNTERLAQTQPVSPQTASTPAKPGETNREPDPTPPGAERRNGRLTERAAIAKHRLGNVVRLVTANGGKVIASQQSMARQLGLSKSRVNEVLRQLEAAGQVKLHTSQVGHDSVAGSGLTDCPPSP